MALLLDGPGIKPTAAFGIGVMLSCIDTAPFGACLPPDSSPEGFARNIAMNDVVREEIFAEPIARYQQAMSDIGIKKALPFLLDAPYIVYAKTLSL